MQFNIGADDADRWRKNLKRARGRRRSLTSNAAIWTLIVVAMTMSIVLIVLKAL
ncbi:hypothetical protein RFM99_15730 [Mesorhizobium sp. VK4C]|uniref:hypothetical protein n=1 Tax=Mesorhizobium captivum TaxID=3072319 RepID=UPI002A23A3C7|nr:hypothetical protein [Mesorhizobium sp. VK4C]MDX8499869.1 hypothetical protein [Mesorhizobium sp. VK4C]